MANTCTNFGNKMYKFKRQLKQFPKKLFCRYFHSKHFNWDENFDIKCNKCNFVFKI